MLLTIVIFATLVISLLLSDHSWNNVLSPERNNAVFESRNRHYGAYALRREHPRNVLLALLVSSVLFVTAGLLLMRVTNEREIHLFNDILTVLDSPSTIPVELPKNQKSSATGQKGGTRSGNEQHNTTAVVADKGPVVGPPEDPIDHEIGPAGTGLADIIPGGPTAGSGLLGASADSTEIYEVVQEMPEFPGGEKQMLQWLSDHMKPLERPGFDEVRGTVWVTFVISGSGEVVDATLVTGLKGQQRINDKAVKVVSSMPDWKPGKMNGRPVNVRLRVPFRIHLR